MKQKQARAIAKALGGNTWVPTDEQRRLVRLHAFNAVPEPRIAAMMGTDVGTLRYLFARELGYGTDELMAMAADNIINLANQQADLGVAFRANALLLQSRRKVWRVPSDMDRPDPDEAQAVKSIARMTISEMEAELASIRAREAEGETAGSPDPEEEGEGEPA